MRKETFWNDAPSGPVEREDSGLVDGWKVFASMIAALTTH